jgi:hypothetical protein
MRFSLLENDLKILSTCKARKNAAPFPEDSKHLPGLEKIAVVLKTILDICTLYTVYKNLMNPHLIAAAAWNKRPHNC